MPARCHGIPPNQSSARLPDLRSGRRMSPAGIQCRIWACRFAFSREQGQKTKTGAAWVARYARRRALHLVLALHSILSGNRERRRPWFTERGGHTTLTAHPDKPLENNYSLNTVDICPVGALTSSDFRFQMRVWFLKETKSICTSCATGCNTIIGSREDLVYRQTPRENVAVNSAWMC